jgi:hypothetical protein
MKQRISVRSPRPVMKVTLIMAIQEEGVGLLLWKLGSSVLHCLLECRQSMMRRGGVVIRSTEFMLI